jgi:hypothetical protein
MFGYWGVMEQKTRFDSKRAASSGGGINDTSNSSMLPA